MEPLIAQFFPSVYLKMQADEERNQYCKFNSLRLNAFNLSLSISSLIAALVAPLITRCIGRRWLIFFGGLTLIIGSSINGAANNVAMLITGRILLGFGAGFVNLSVLVYFSEMAPQRLRYMVNTCFQLMNAIGILVAQLSHNQAAKAKGEWVWWVSQMVVIVSGMIITIGSLCLPDAPNSLIESKPQQDNVAASEASKLVAQPWPNIFKRKYRPQLAMAILIPFFQQLTGITPIMFYAPVLFKTIGLASESSFMPVAIAGGAINVVATLVSILTIDRVSRRLLFFEGGAQMLVCQIVLGMMIGIKFGTSAIGHSTKMYAWFVVTFYCIYIAGFVWSWGSLGCLVPLEIFPSEIRSIGQSISGMVNMLSNFLLCMFFPIMLCHMTFGLFYFFGGWVVIMTIFIYFFLPETKNVPIEDMGLIWKKHWFWGRFISDEDVAHATNELIKPTNSQP